MSTSPIKHGNANIEGAPRTRSRKSVGPSSFKIQMNTVAYMNEIFLAFRNACEVHQCKNIPSPINIDEDKKLSHLVDNPYKIYVGLKKVDGLNELDKVFFKNNGMESEIIVALNSWLEPYRYMSTLKFENCQLTSDHMDSLADILRKHSTIKYLSLNGNHLEQQNHSVVLRDTQLLSLSVKWCGINPEGIMRIAQELSTPTGNSLLHLNLASNDISDGGIIYVAEFLRINRNLLSLNLADNKLRSNDCDSLMQSLQKFQLNDNDIVLRRRIKFEIYKQNIGRDDPRGVVKKSSKAMKKISKVSERLLQSSSAGGIAKRASECSFILEAPYHPFVKDSYEEVNGIYCKGNDNLTNLNLSCNYTSCTVFGKQACGKESNNRIREKGIEKLLDMLKYQRNNYADDKGLSRISIEGNDLNDNASTCYEIEELLSRKHSIAAKQSNSQNTIKRNSSLT